MYNCLRIADNMNDDEKKKEDKTTLEQVRGSNVMMNKRK